MVKIRNRVLIVLIFVLFFVLFISACAATEAATEDDLVSRLNDCIIEMVLENYEVESISASDVVIDKIYYGSFSREGSSEIFVVCKILNTTHAAGCGQRAGVLLNADTWEMITYKLFMGDETVINCMPISNGQNRILFFQTAIYQGIPAQKVELYAIQDDQWIELPIDIMENVPMERREALDRKCFCYMSGERMVVVYEDSQFGNELAEPAELIAIFIWNPDTEQFVLEN